MRPAGIPLKLSRLSVFVLFVAGASTLPACGKKNDSPSAMASASAAAAGSAAPSTSASASASASAGTAAGSAAASGPFHGSFVAKVGKVTVQADVKDTTAAWGKDPGKDSVGPGTLSLTIEKDRVFGTGAGSLGDLVVEGHAEDKDIRAVLNPKDPNAANAMTGVLDAKVDGDKIVGTIRVSGRNGNLVREAEITLSPGSKLSIQLGIRLGPSARSARPPSSLPPSASSLSLPPSASSPNAPSHAARGGTEISPNRPRRCFVARRHSGSDVEHAKRRIGRVSTDYPPPLQGFQERGVVRRTR